MNRQLLRRPTGQAGQNVTATATATKETTAHAEITSTPGGSAQADSEDEFDLGPSTSKGAKKKKITRRPTHPCKRCAATFYSEEDLEDHYVDIHTVTCDVCGKSFRRGYGLNVHMRKVHNIEKEKEVVIDYIKID